jgi:hypothetical protein
MADNNPVCYAHSFDLSHSELTPNPPQTSTPTKSSTGGNGQNPESPTTARPLDFDDEPQDAGVSSTPSKPGAEAEAPPPKPPRPLSPRQQAETTLKEAFPSLDAGVIKAVLTASGYNVERAFHALLGSLFPAPPPQLVPGPFQLTINHQCQV